MDAMKKVCETLNNSTRLKYEQKVELLDLIYDFHLRFPSVSLENLCYRLKFLRIEEGSKLQYPDAIQYAPFENKIVIVRERELRLKNDRRHNMMRAVLALIASNSIYYGFNGNSSLEALNEGYCDVLANNLTGGTRITGDYYEEDEELLTTDYEDEQILVNFIGKSIGLETFEKAFFENDPDLIMKTLLSKCSSPEKLEGFLSQTNNNLKTRRATGVSRLFHIQSQAMKMFEYDKDYIMTKQAMEISSNIKYLDVEELDDLIKEQMRDWARGKTI